MDDILLRSELGRRRQPAPEFFFAFSAVVEDFFFVAALAFELRDEADRALLDVRDVDFRLPAARAFLDVPLSRMV